ncbi:Uncharacterised protein [Acinetobacter baumannii]|nr:Uncharacterised protein [Acinetobacter baumannii]
MPGFARDPRRPRTPGCRYLGNARWPDPIGTGRWRESDFGIALFETFKLDRLEGSCHIHWTDERSLQFP